jgi:hypothetical protein
MHRADQLGRAQRQVHELIRGLLIEAAKNGDVRDDVSPDELADFCVEALRCTRHRSRAAIRRLVTVTLAGLRPPAT